MSTNPDSMPHVSAHAYPRLQLLCSTVSKDLPRAPKLDWQLLFAWSVFAAFGQQAAGECCGGALYPAKKIARDLAISHVALLNSINAVCGWKSGTYPSFQHLPELCERACAFATRHGIGKDIEPALHLGLGIVCLPPLIVMQEEGQYVGLSKAHEVYMFPVTQLLYLARQLAPLLSAGTAEDAVESLARVYGYRNPQSFAGRVCHLANAVRVQSTLVANNGVHNA